MSKYLIYKGERYVRCDDRNTIFVIEQKHGSGKWYSYATLEDAKRDIKNIAKQQRLSVKDYIIVERDAETNQVIKKYS